MKQLGESGIGKNQKGPLSGQQTRRSMIARQENPPAINQPHIEDILALQLSDTLINAAYNLATTNIILALHRLANPTEALFAKTKMIAFQNIHIYANRKDIINEKHEPKKGFEQGLESRHSILTHIELLKEESVIKEDKNQAILLTKQLHAEKVRSTLKKKLQKVSQILKMKLSKSVYSAFLFLQIYPCQTGPEKFALKTSVQQTFEKYQQTRNNPRHFHRRSIDKQPQRKSSNQLTYSLNKPYECQLGHGKSPQRNINSKNLLYGYGGNVDKKASTCSQTQSNNSQKQEKNPVRDYAHGQMGKMVQGSLVLAKLKAHTNKNLQAPGITIFNESRVSSLLMNGSYFAEGTKERELEILRNKYFRLVEEFRDFSERFLQVIKEE